MFAAGISFPPWVLALGGVFGVLGILGSSYVVLRSSIAAKTTELWKQQAEAFEERLTHVEADNKRCKVENDILKTENDALKSRVQTLESTVTAGPAIEALRRDIATNHVELLGLFEKGEVRGRTRKT